MQYHSLFPSIPNAERPENRRYGAEHYDIDGAWDDPFLVFSTENDRVATIELRKNYYKAG